MTSRDRSIIDWLFESKVSNSHQLRRKFFAKGTHQALYRRLNRLHRGGWLSKTGYYERSKLRFVFTITEKSSRLIIGPDCSQVDIPTYRSYALEHDIALAEIRMRFDSLGMIKAFVPENRIQHDSEFLESVELKTYVGLRSDALMKVRFVDRRELWIPLEYEASLKSRERSYEKLLSYYTKSEAPAVLFVSRNSPIQRRMKEMDQEICKDFKSKVYFALFDDVVSTKENVTFTKTNGKKLILS